MFIFFLTKSHVLSLPKQSGWKLSLCGIFLIMGSLAFHLRTALQSDINSGEKQKHFNCVHNEALHSPSSGIFTRFPKGQRDAASVPVMFSKNLTAYKRKQEEASEALH